MLLIGFSLYNLVFMLQLLGLGYYVFMIFMIFMLTCDISTSLT